MAKLKGKRKAAFLRRMALGRARARRCKGGGKTRGRARRITRKLKLHGTARPSKKRQGSYVLRLTNPYAVIANPASPYGAYRAARARGMTAYEAFKSSRGWTGPKRTKTRKKRRTIMAKSRRGRKSSHRRKGRGRKRRIAALRPSRRTRYVYINPRKRRSKARRRHHSRPRRRLHRHRNPGFGGALTRAFTPYATGFVTSIAAAVLDTVLADKAVLRNAAKLGGAVAIAIFGRRHPTAATSAIAAIAASQGYSLGTKLAGGFIAHNPAQAKHGLGEMVQAYPEMAALLNGSDGVSALLNGMGGIDETVTQYQKAVNNMAGDEN